MERGDFSKVSRIEEIEQAVEQLPLDDFAKLAVWVDQRRQQLKIFPSDSGKAQAPRVIIALS